MTRTPEDIALMAKLVPELVDNVWSRQAGKPMTVGDEWRGAYVMREWQPWLDWRDLGPLYLAAMYWCEGNPMPLKVREALVIVVDAALGNNFAAFAEAVCNLAIEIGKVMS
jgi:hypothetical protein